MFVFTFSASQQQFHNIKINGLGENRVKSETHNAKKSKKVFKSGFLR